MATATLDPQPEIPSDLETLTSHVHDLADRLRQDAAEHDRRHALSSIWEMERTLRTLEYEILDGEQCGNGDAC